MLWVAPYLSEEHSLHAKRLEVHLLRTYTSKGQKQITPLNKINYSDNDSIADRRRTSLLGDSHLLDLQ